MGKKRGEIINFLKNKKGLSNIIATLIIILLVIVATGVVWIVIRNVILGGTGGIELGRFTYDLNIRGAYLTTENAIGVAKVIVRRNPGGENLTGIRFAFSDGSDEYIVDRKMLLQETQERTFTFNSTEVGVSSVTSLSEVSIAPIYEVSGRERVGDVADTAIIGRNPPPGGGGGTEGAVCGNDICESGESSITCPADCTIGESVLCENNLIESGESCECGNDGVCGTSDDNLNGNSCTTLPGGYTGGILRCSISCQFDTSQCTGAPPASCNRVWSPPEDAGVQCDGGANCRPDCTCPAGYSADGIIGGCILNPPINSGTIFSTWPTGAQKYFDSDNLPKSPSEISLYTNYYVNFSNSAETGCFRATFAEYLSDVDRSYLRLIDVANINANENYHVWQAANCGQ